MYALPASSSSLPPPPIFLPRNNIHRHTVCNNYSWHHSSVLYRDQINEATRCGHSNAEYEPLPLLALAALDKDLDRSRLHLLQFTDCIYLTKCTMIKVSNLGTMILSRYQTVKYWVTINHSMLIDAAMWGEHYGGGEKRVMQIGNIVSIIYSCITTHFCSLFCK